MIAPNGQIGDVPASRVSDATKAGFKLGVELTAPSGQVGVIPQDRVGDAIKAGFKRSQGPHGPQPEGLQRTPADDASDQAHAAADELAQKYSRSFGFMAGGGLQTVGEATPGIVGAVKALAGKLRGASETPLGQAAVGAAGELPGVRTAKRMYDAGKEAYDAAQAAKAAEEAFPAGQPVQPVKAADFLNNATPELKAARAAAVAKYGVAPRVPPATVIKVVQDAAAPVEAAPAEAAQVVKPVSEIPPPNPKTPVPNSGPFGKNASFKIGPSMTEGEEDRAISEGLRQDMENQGHTGRLEFSREHAPTSKADLVNQARNLNFGSKVLDLKFSSIGNENLPLKYPGGLQAYKQAGQWFVKGGQFGREFTEVNPSDLEAALRAGESTTPDLTKILQDSLDAAKKARQTRGQ